MDKNSQHATNGIVNKAFASDGPGESSIDSTSTSDKFVKQEPVKQQWGNNREFLLSCIAMSVGLGNLWRFPFTAYENGGGAFLLPYIIILIVVGKPLYLLEMAIGQFSSRSAVKVWDMTPAFRGIGIAQFISSVALASYYCSLMALTIFYLIASFQSELPWGKCREEWGEFCVDSQPGNNSQRLVKNSSSHYPGYSSSAELYFYKEVLHEKADINDGIGMPDWRLTLCLLASWLVVLVVVIRGVKSTGKAAYFLAIFPYIVMIILLIRAVTLEGSLEGILYFVTPKWEKLWTAEVWYHAVGQCFFSLTICFGAVIMFASHNKIDHNIYRDAMIVTTLDTVTSLLAGCTIFGILGNLSHELGVKDIGTVIQGGTGLAFISYPETIVKFTVLPQFFAILFFVMIFVLGIGSETGLVSSIIAIVHEQFPKLKYWQIAVGICLIEFLIGLIYVTPGGQFMVTFVDYYATSFIAFVPAALEMIAVCWSYGLQNFLDDIEFMLKRRLSIFWRFCWAVLTPGIIIAIFVYSLMTLSTLTYKNVLYPDIAYIIGWIFFFIAIVQIPLWIMIAIYKKRFLPPKKSFITAFLPSNNWGPLNSEVRKRWMQFKEDKKRTREEEEIFHQNYFMIFKRPIKEKEVP